MLYKSPTQTSTNARTNEIGLLLIPFDPTTAWHLAHVRTRSREVRVIRYQLSSRSLLRCHACALGRFLHVLNWILASAHHSFDQYGNDSTGTSAGAGLRRSSLTMRGTAKGFVTWVAPAIPGWHAVRKGLSTKFVVHGPKLEVRLECEVLYSTERKCRETRTSPESSSTLLTVAGYSCLALVSS